MVVSVFALQGGKMQVLNRQLCLASCLTEKIGGPAATRTRDLLLRRQSLYPPELQAHNLVSRFEFRGSNPKREMQN
jgi:hypothetical protein